MEIGSSKNLTPSVNELSSEVLEAGLASICGLSSRRVVAVWTAPEQEKNVEVIVKLNPWKRRLAFMKFID